MSLVNNFNTDSNFWKTNPAFKTMGPFKEFHKSDKSRDKKNSSQIMWAVALLLDPSEKNIYSKLDSEKKQDLLASDFIKNPKFEWEKYSEVTEFYKNNVLTAAEKSLVVWNETMETRDKMLKDLYKEALESRDIDMIKKVDDLLANTAKFFSQYNQIKKNFDEEIEKRGAGDKIMSLSSSGEI